MQELLASERKEEKSYCVTGASGYIGSWLVKSLLQKGYKVHATVRNAEKSQYLLEHWEAKERVRLFRADLQEEGSFDEAVRGCTGIFHVAAPMEFDVPRQRIRQFYWGASRILVDFCWMSPLPEPNCLALDHGTSNLRAALLL